MTDAIKAQILEKAARDIYNALRDHVKDLIINLVEVNHISVLEHEEGFSLKAKFSVTSNAFVFSNTHKQEIVLEYSKSGEVLRVTSLKQLTEFGLKLGLASPFEKPVLPGKGPVHPTDVPLDKQKQCPKCRSFAIRQESKWTGRVPEMDRAIAWHQMRHPAHGWMLAARFASLGIKAAASNVYSCLSCSHVWRVWFPS